MEKEVYARQQIHVAMYAFANGQFSDNPEEYSDLLGVVAFVDNQGHGLIAVKEDEKDVTWEQAKHYCSHYSMHGVLSGDGMLLSREQWKQINKNILYVNGALEDIGEEQIDGFYWTKSEYNDFNAWCVRSTNCNSPYWLSKDEFYDVRCFVAF